MIIKAKQIISSVLALCLCFTLLPYVATPAKAESTGLTLAELREKFPHGKYWNHADNPGASNSVNNQDGYTSIPCPRHGTIGTGSQTCNGYQPDNYQRAWQCMGFAYKLGYDATGLDPRTAGNGWIKYTSTSALNNLKPGDIVRYANDGHSIYVTGVEGDIVTYVDCNRDGHCVITWDRTVTKAKLRESFTYVCSAPIAAGGDQVTCGCSEEYAGTYICNTASSSLNIRGGHGTFYGIVGSIPRGAEVTVSMAGDEWAHVTYNGISGFASMDYLKKVDTGVAPQGMVEAIIGGMHTVTISGWAFDADDLEAQLELRVYVGGECYTLTADAHRPDIDEEHGCGEYHGFEQTIAVDKALTGEQKVDVYAVNVEGGSDQLLGYYTVTLEGDSSGPVISDVSVTNVDTAGYTVSCTVTDENGVDRVQFPTWTERDGQDDLPENWENDSAVSITPDGETYTYRVETSDHNGEAGVYITRIDAYDIHGNSASLTVDPVLVPAAVGETKPAIISQPQDINADSGETVYFCVAAEGDAVSYKWEYRKLYKWFGTAMEGFDTDTLTVEATGNRNGYDYRCVITFADGTVLYSEPAELTVNTYITDVQSPKDQTVVLGYTGQFTAYALGEGIKYQWQYQRVGNDKWINTAMEGATKPTVMIETTTARDGYKYRCAITDVTGNVVYTESATMRVLSITEQPEGITAKANDTVQFKVAASVESGIGYQWQYRRSEAGAWINTTMSGYNTDTLTVSATKARNGYQYRCVLTGAKNSKIVSEGATLCVIEPVAITAQPKNVGCVVGETAVFSVEATSAAGYQWQYARPGSNVWSNTSMEGAATASLKVQAIASRNGYRYRCVIKGVDDSEMISQSATLTVQ